MHISVPLISVVNIVNTICDRISENVHSSHKN